jgi:hypothetical protein
VAHKASRRNLYYSGVVAYQVRYAGLPLPLWYCHPAFGTVGATSEVVAIQVRSP